LIAILYRPK